MSPVRAAAVKNTNNVMEKQDKLFTFETQIRVRYAETDQMGFVYYGNYPQYYEVARADSMRKLGMTYREMEEKGVVMPIAQMEIKYIKPAYYDELLTVKTHVPELPHARMHFDYEIYNEAGALINKGMTVLAFIGKESGRPCAAPSWFLDKLREESGSRV